MALNYAALKATPVQESPFPHCVVPLFVSPADVKAAIDDYPAIDMAGIFPLDTIEGGPAFRNLVAEIQGPELRALIGEKFGMDLSDHDTMVTVRARCRGTDGKIHTDSTFKKATLLLYLNDQDWPHPGGHLRILRSGTDLEDYAAEVPPVGGTLVAFKCTENAWHGHKPFEGVRRYLMMNFVADKGALKRQLSRHRFSAAVKKVKRLFGLGKISADYE